MSRRRWTVLVIPDDQNEVRQFNVRRGLLRFAVTGSVIFVVTLISLAAGFFVKEAQQRKVVRLENERLLLTQELDSIQSKLAVLRADLEHLSNRDDLFRLLAGLNPMDQEVRQAGIGGPGMPRIEANPLWRKDRELGAETFATAYDLSSLLRRVNILSESWAEAQKTVLQVEDSLASMPSIWPAQGYLSSGFSTRRWHPLAGAYLPHEGVDISAPQGTPIVATARGTVTRASRHGNYGLTVEIDHGYDRQTLYAHASRLHVRVGQQVERGDIIAEVGNTGRSTGPHVHYEVHVDGRPVNPRRFMVDWGEPQD